MQVQEACFKWIVTFATVHPCKSQAIFLLSVHKLFDSKEKAMPRFVWGKCCLSDVFIGAIMKENCPYQYVGVNWFPRTWQVTLGCHEGLFYIIFAEATFHLDARRACLVGLFGVIRNMSITMHRIRKTSRSHLQDILISMLISESNSPSPPRTLAPALLSGVRGLKLVVLRCVLTYQVRPAIHGTQRRRTLLSTKSWLFQARRANYVRDATMQASLPRPLLLLPSPPRRLLDCFSGRIVLEQVSKEPPFRQLPSIPACFNLNGPH